MYNVDHKIYYAVKIHTPREWQYIISGEGSSWHFGHFAGYNSKGI